jgi:hypothetical protein
VADLDLSGLTDADLDHIQAYQAGDASVLQKLSDQGLTALEKLKIQPLVPQADEKAMAKEAGLEGAIGTLGMPGDIMTLLNTPMEKGVSWGLSKLGIQPTELKPEERPLTSAWLKQKATDLGWMGDPNAQPLSEADKRYYETVKGVGAAAPIAAPVLAAGAVAGAPIAATVGAGGLLLGGGVGGWLGESQAQGNPDHPELARLGGNVVGGVGAQSGLNALSSLGRTALGSGARALGATSLADSISPKVSPTMARYEAEGISPMSLGDVTGKSWQQQLQRVTGEALGGSGVSHSAAERYGNSFEAAVGRYADKAGLAGRGPVEASEAGSNIQQGLKEWKDLMIGSNRLDANGVPMPSKYEELMQDVYKRVPPSTPIDASSSAMALADKVGDLPGVPPYLKKAYANWAAGKPTAFEDLKELRNQVGDIARSAERSGTGGLATGTVGSRYYNQLYGALSKDMEAGLMKAGGPEAADAWLAANRHYSQTLSTIENALGSIAGAKTPEAAFAAAQAGIFNPKGGATNLQTLKNALHEGGEPGKAAWEKFVGKTVGDLGKANPADPADFNINTFFKNYNSLNEDAKNVLFAGPGKGDVRKGLDNLSQIAAEAKVGNKFYNTSKTAATNQIMKLMEKIPELAGGLAVGGGLAMETGNAAAIPATIAGNWALQKVLTSPTFIRWASSVPSPEALPRSIAALVGSSNGLPSDERAAILAFAQAGGYQPRPSTGRK